MNDITALMARIKASADEASYPVLSPDDCRSLVETLEKAQQQKESDFEIKARLCKESNGLHDRLREAEKHIAELEKAATEPVAWTDELELRDVERNGFGYLFTVNPITPHADPRRIIKLYTVQPAMKSRTVTVKLPEVRITVAESKQRGMTNRELNAHNAGALEGVDRVSKTLTAAGIQVIEGEGQ